ncbi:MAG: CCA tRNA nucleotidyltransferase [Thermodesulfobacteriota bacterium]
MKKILDFENESYKSALRVIEPLRSKGHKAFFVGGCVRDSILGLKPKEIDITTSADPKEVQRIFKRTVPIGESFGVVLVLINEKQFEVATFRNESQYEDGRHPEYVSYSQSEKDDVLRRDFTINGMLYDPFSNEIYDYTEGLSDLDKKVIRTIGDPYERFSEDKLRMIRAVRFASRFGFSIESKTWSAVISMAEDIKTISMERIRDEIIKIITQKNPGAGLKMLHESGLLKHLVSEISDMDGVKQPPEFHPEGDVFTHTCLVLDKLYENTDGQYSASLAMGALLHDVGKPPTYKELDRIRFNGHDRVGAKMSEGICKKLRFSKKQVERISNLVRDHLKFKDSFNMRESTLKKFLSQPYFDEHLKLHRADCMASHGITEAYNYIIDKLKEYSEIEIRPAALLNGKDLIAMGYIPGPIFTKILSSVEEEQLEGRIMSREDAAEFVLQKFSIN